MDMKTTVQQTADHLFQNYRRAPVAFSHGKGARLYGLDGKEYLDFIAGIATSSLGHAHPALVQAITEQASRYLHVSNLYYIPEQTKAAMLLTERAGSAGLGRAFFCNSGAEANEAAIKLARKWAKATKGQGPFEIIVTHNSFHGRTLATVAATGNPHYQEGFEPLPAGFKFVPYNDLAAAEAAITPPSVCAILMEPAQGEGGVIPATKEYLQGLAALCKKHNLLLILDEVQSGIGRTGTLFAYEQYGIQPDVVTLAKGLGGGVPVGAVLARDSVAAHLVPGTHGTTFGGNPLATAATAAVLETIQKEGILDNVKARGEQLVAGLRRLHDKHGVVEEIRALGLWSGVDLTIDAGPLVEACMNRGLLINAVRPRTLRIAPPLVTTAADVDAALHVLDDAITSVKAAAAPA